jgi:hypothetical protein
MAGLSATGFTVKTFTEIKAAIETKIKAVISPYANILPESVFGQLTAISSEGLSELWDLMQAIYTANTIAATGVSLDNVATNTGKRREAATSGKITGFALTFSGAATVPAGSTFSSSVDSWAFALAEDVVAAGAGTETATVYAVVAGSHSVSDAEITIIDTPVANLTSVTNPAITSRYFNGTDQEADAGLRVRIQTVSNSRLKTTDAIAQTILDMNDDRDTLGTLEIDQATVVVNENHVFDADGRDPHSIEVVVYYNANTPDAVTDTEICKQIALTKGDSIKTVSTTLLSYTETIDIDDYATRPITFSRPDEVDIYVDITTTPALTAGEKTSLKTWIEEWGNDLGIGTDVIYNGTNSLLSRIATWNGTTEITGLVVTLGIAPAPAGTANIAIDPTEISIWDSANIDIT